MADMPRDMKTRPPSPGSGPQDARNPGELTQLIQKTAHGDQEAEAQLVDRVYGELRAMAQRVPPNPNSTFQPTEIVHEAWMRIFRKGDFKAPNRRYFFGAAAIAMRRILIEHARKPRPATLQWSLWHEVISALRVSQRIDYVELHEALELLKERSERQSEIVTLRFWGGLTMQEIADHLDVSLSTVEKDWHAARAWLHRCLQGGRI